MRNFAIFLSRRRPSAKADVLIVAIFSFRGNPCHPWLIFFLPLRAWRSLREALRRCWILDVGGRMDGIKLWLPLDMGNNMGLGLLSFCDYAPKPFHQG